MMLIVNNQKREYPDCITLQAVITSLEPGVNHPEAVMCALNGTLVNPPYDYILSEMDQIRVLPIPEGG